MPEICIGAVPGGGPLKRPAVGLFTWAFVTAVGTAALVAVNEVGFLVLKIAGACVLVYLGCMPGGGPE
jgi:hypothetical protein